MLSENIGDCGLLGVGGQQRTSNAVQLPELKILSGPDAEVLVEGRSQRSFGNVRCEGQIGNTHALTSILIEEIHRSLNDLIA